MYNSDYYCHYSEQVGEKVISCSNKNTCNYACDEHSHLVHNAYDMYDIVKGYAVATVKIYLQECKDTKGKPGKALVSKKIYDFLFEHPIFLIKNEKFMVTAYNKLLEYKEENIEEYMNVPEYIDKFKQLTGITDYHPGVTVSPEQAIPLKLKNPITSKKSKVSKKSKEPVEANKIIKIKNEKMKEEPSKQLLDQIDNVKPKRRRPTKIVYDNFEEMVIDL